MWKREAAYHFFRMVLSLTIVGIRIFFFLISVLIIFTSHDIIILTFTPFLCYFCKRCKISPLPYLIRKFVAANTWSSLLIIGNPTNIYLASYENISSFFNWSRWLIALCFALSLLLVRLIYSLVAKENHIVLTLKWIPYNLIPFVLSRFILVLAINETGVSYHIRQGFRVQTRSFPMVLAVYWPLISSTIFRWLSFILLCLLRQKQMLSMPLLLLLMSLPSLLRSEH